MKIRAPASVTSDHERIGSNLAVDPPKPSNAAVPPLPKRGGGGGERGVAFLKIPPLPEGFVSTGLGLKLMGGMSGLFYEGFVKGFRKGWESVREDEDLYYALRCWRDEYTEQFEGEMRTPEAREYAKGYSEGVVSGRIEAWRKQTAAERERD